MSIDAIAWNRPSSPAPSGRARRYACRKNNIPESNIRVVTPAIHQGGWLLSFRLTFFLSMVLVLQPLSPAQADSGSAQAEAPVPNDPLELVTGAAEPVQNADQRLAAVNLLKSARSLSNVRGQPYDLKTTFSASGSPSSDGVWNLEDVSPSAGVYRWTAQSPSFSVINLFTGGLLYSSRPSGGIPLRLAQVRAAIFFNDPWIGPRASVRTANGTLNGADLNCFLIAHMAGTRIPAGGRRWEESEYCVDARSGLLTTWSPAPGVYVLYDYSTVRNFHGKTIPGGFTITQAGQTVVEARVESVTDPAKADPAWFDPSTLSQTGVGSLMTRPWLIRSVAMQAGANPNVILHAVLVHGMVTPDGKLTETEIVASSDARLNQSAIRQAARRRSWRSEEEPQPGATPQAHEVFLLMQFAVPAS